MKKNNKGLTLIELLAIIVILAIIAVITIPVILNVIENSRKGASVDSAYGYKESVQQYYILKAVSDYNDQASSGYKKVSSLSSEGFSVSGDTPTDGWVKLDKGQVIDFSLKFGDYVVSYDKTTNSAVSVKNGEIGPMPEVKLYRKNATTDELEKINKNEMQSGDIVILKSDDIEEHFIVFKEDPKAPTGMTALLSKYNINTSTGYQAVDAATYPVAFSNTNYWNVTGQTYPVDVYEEKNEDGTYKSSVMSYVYNYVQNLVVLGFTGVDSGRILTRSEVTTNGIASSAALKITGTNYWTGTALRSENIYSVSANGGYGNMPYSSTTVVGVRPLIYINTDDIE